MIYTKRCLTCGRVVDLIRPLSRRDDAESCATTVGLGEHGDPPKEMCTGVLVRDGIELNAMMKEQWTRWWRGFAAGQKTAQC